jgi:hypothetical protein
MEPQALCSLDLSSDYNLPFLFFEFLLQELGASGDFPVLGGNETETRKNYVSGETESYVFVGIFSRCIRQGNQACYVNDWLQLMFEILEGKLQQRLLRYDNIFSVILLFHQQLMIA